jgi:Helix-turn-helix domain
MKDQFPDEVVAAKKKRQMKPRIKWKKYQRPGRGELLNIQELAAALGESVRTVRNWQYKGIVPHLSLGHRQVRFRLGSVLDALERRQVKRRFFQQVPL